KKTTISKRRSSIRHGEAGTPRTTASSGWSPTSAKAGSICPALPITPIMPPIALGSLEPGDGRPRRQERREARLSHQPDRILENAEADEAASPGARASRGQGA